jgi:NAD(P)-dependent dehydrogenase (short-subunit alcohol dehydrogenase family)
VRALERNQSVNEVFDLSGRVAIITGGGTGIGRSTALILAEHGADVVLAGRRSEPLESTAAEVRDHGRRALPVSTDMTSAQACDELVAATLAEFGGVDVVVNNAGGARMQPADGWTEEEWNYTLALNLGSAYFLSRAAAPSMIERGKGAIVNISSGASMGPATFAVAYGAAKAGLNHLTGSLAAAWGRSGIRVNCIACGAIRAASLTDELARFDIDPDSLGETNGLGRIAEPEEIGWGVLFFASDASSFCSGQTLYISGGPPPGSM